MRRSHMRILWVLCMVAAFALFWLGLGSPYMKSRELAKQRKIMSASTFSENVAPEGDSVAYNYLLGAAAPAALLVGSIVIFSLVPARDR